MSESLKRMIGRKVRKLRESIGMTREEICDDESQVSIRQLARIEKGEALPKLETLLYLSSQLDVAVENIVDPNRMVLPRAYLDLKHKITTYHTYEDLERERQKDKWLQQIKTDYYDDLPEEEQVWFQVLEATSEVAKTYDTLFAEPVLEDYFDQVVKKTTYSVNDLQLISLYFMCGEFGMKLDENISRHLKE